MTNSLAVVAKVFSNTSLIVLLQKCEELLLCKSYPYFLAKKKKKKKKKTKENEKKKKKKKSNVFAIFQDKHLNVTLANNFVNFEKLGPDS